MKPNEIDYDEVDDLYNTHKLLADAGFDGLAESWDLETARVTAEMEVVTDGARREIIGVVEMEKNGEPVRIYTARILAGKAKGYEKDPSATEFITEEAWLGMENRVKELLRP
ncbi:hypothetical protein HQ524_01845 [Candidatus Uhrbacteria bacterium]|nr:hypothetical protein [Candidatus Uhrbacteria bacterium]